MVFIAEIIDSLIMFVLSIFCFIIGLKPKIIIKKEKSLNYIKKNKIIFIIIAIVLFLIGIIRLANNIFLL